TAGLRVVGGIAGLTRALLVGEAEQHPAVLVLWLDLELRLQLGDERRRAGAEREAGLEVLDGLRPGERARRRGRRAVEGAAEERDEAGGDEGGESDQDLGGHVSCP